MILERLLTAIDEAGSAALVTLAQARGSSPREAGARMVVRWDGFLGTIGGGALEWEALALARTALARGPGTTARRDLSLGPDLGQCCGGRVTLEIEVFGPSDRPRAAALAAQERATDPSRHVLLFGAGHVGRALAQALAHLPFRLRWIDERDDAFPAAMPGEVEMVLARAPEAEVAGAPAGAALLVLTHSHARDLSIVAAALERGDLPFVGLIGSATKRARFEKRLAALGLGQEARARLVCPIGLPGIEGKEPGVIAASVAAQLLMLRADAAAGSALARNPDEAEIEI